MVVCARRLASGDGYWHGPSALISRSAATTRLARSCTVSPTDIPRVLADAVSRAFPAGCAQFLVLPSALRGQVGVHDGGTFPPFVDRPDHERRAAPRVAAREHARPRRRVVVGAYVTAFIF